VTTSANESLWLAADEANGHPPMAGDLDVDVAVIGGGITGLTTALLLKRDGARVAVVEAHRVGSGVTGCTTAKGSALQQTMYSTICRYHDSDAAAIYADASLAAVEAIATLAEAEQIDCNLERRAAYTYAASAEERSAVEREHEAAQATGLPVEFVEELELPYPVHGAVRLDDQVQLHPVRYAQGLARAIDGGGSAVFEGTRAVKIEPRGVRTDGGTITAAQVVDAAHYPILDRGLFFARLEPERSYCIAARVNRPVPDGMSISSGSPTRSVRSYGELLIVAGEGHSAGARKATPSRYERLKDFAEQHWGVLEVTNRWSAQDPVSWDHLPVIGRYHPGSSRLFVASGFHKWGLTSGTFAARIISDLIAGRENPWAAQFKPTRVGARGMPKVAQLGAKFSLDFIADRAVPATKGSAADVKPGEGAAVRDGLGKVGVYRDPDGTVHAVSLRCTHLGCLLRFNSAERSWDCPCHGSRFDVDGAVLEGPATQPLERRHVDASPGR
jgi:glycine/D-amino acid oxidase-like deaminating enzyme/nitrite reductase/ring-hydroxylating ferredoxin subunit